MSSAIPGDFFKRKAAAQAHVKTMRRFDEIDTDSDIDFGLDDAKKSQQSLSFQTEATEKVEDARKALSVNSRNLEASSNGSINFNMDSDEEPAAVLKEAKPPAVRATAATTPAAHAPPPAAPQPQAGPQSLADQFFAHLAPGKQPGGVQKPAQPAQRPADAPAKKALSQPPPQQQQPPAVPPVKSAAPPPKVISKIPMPAAVSAQAQPTPAPTVTVKAAVVPPPPQRPQPLTSAVPKESALPDAPARAPAVQPVAREEPRRKDSQQQRNSPPTTALTSVYDGEGFATKQQSFGVEEEDDGELDRDSDGGFAEYVLPTSRTPQHQEGAAPSLAHPPRASSGGVVVESSDPRRYDVLPQQRYDYPSQSARDPSEDLLVRARLRLEEKRRTEAANAVASRSATPTRSGGAGGASNGLLLSANRGSTTPRTSNFYLSTPPPAPITGRGFRESSAPRSGQPPSYPHERSSANVVEAKVRRLTQENTRLQDEIGFLGRENQKLRSVAGSADSAENVKMQLTIDLLRRELQSKEMTHQATLKDFDVERSAQQHQMSEMRDQNEGYMATASQYKLLYEEKIKDLEDLKLQCQRLAQDVETLEYRQHNETQQHGGELDLEREKTGKLLFLLEDVKKQREHLHELNQQLQLEIVTINEEKVSLKRGLEATEERSKRSKESSDQLTENLQRDIEKLKESLAEKDRVSAAQVREEQRAKAVLQRRFEEAAVESKEEADRLRRSIDLVREDGKRTLLEEREKRMTAEEKLRRAESDHRAAITSLKEKAAEESEKRERRLRDELNAERSAREAAQLELGRIAEDLDHVQGSLEHSTEQYQALSADFAHSEEMRDRAEQQCSALSTALQDLMHHDELQTRHVGQLEATVAELQQQVGDVPLAVGSSSLGVDGPKHSLAAQLQLLSGENERLTTECARLADERDALIDENGKIAEELIKWKNEMRQFVSSQLKQPGTSARRA